MPKRKYEKTYAGLVGLRVARAKRGYTLAELSERSGVDRCLIGQYENGYRKPQATTLKRLAEALNCEVAELIEE